jgi:hypothetical protein
MNKTTAVLDHMREHGSITQMEATELFGATRLGAIVFNLRRKGHDIETVTMGTTDRYGHAVNYAKYVLHQKEDSQETLQVE